MEPFQIFQLPATISNVRTMNHNALRVVVDTQENVSPEDMARVMTFHGKLGWFVFAPEKSEVRPEDLLKLPKITVGDEEEKSPAQRLRAVLYRHWEQQGRVGEFEVMYRRSMQKLIDSVKEKLL